MTSLKNFLGAAVFAGQRVAFDGASEHVLCVAEPVRSGVLSTGNPEPASPLVMWRDKSAVVEPGRCLQFEARHAELTPESSLTPGHDIQGQVMEDYG